MEEAVKTIVHVELYRNKAGQIDRTASFYVTDLTTGHKRMAWNAGVLAQIEEGGSEGYFDAEWDGEQFSYGNRIPPPTDDPPR